MTRLIVLFCLVAAPAFAQTTPVDPECAGRAIHPSLTPTDRAYLTAAATASYIGTHNGQQPCNVRKCGDGDIQNWVDATDHYGVFSDGVCRAGWSLYRERQLSGQPTGPADADLPALFQPSSTPTPPPPPPPSGVCDEVCIQRVLAPLLAQVQATKADVDAGRAENQQFQSEVRSWKADILTFIGKYGAIIAGTIYGTCKVSGGC